MKKSGLLSASKGEYKNYGRLGDLDALEKEMSNGYTTKALKREGLGDLVDEMQNKATSGDYNHLICVCDEYVQKANEKGC